MAAQQKAKKPNLDGFEEYGYRFARSFVLRSYYLRFGLVVRMVNFFDKVR